MQRTSFGDMQCSVARTLEIVGEWWTPLVLRDIALGISRFDAIQRNLGLSRKVLTQRLQTLVDNEIVQRVAYQDNPPRYDYFLTEKGADLAMVLVAIQQFGDKWIFDEPPLQWRHLACGEISRPVTCCEHCGQEVHPGDAVPLVGPGFSPDGSLPELPSAIARMQELLAPAGS